MLSQGEGPSAGRVGDDPRAPLGHLATLGHALSAADRIDDVAHALLLHLGELPGVSRVGLALSEGAGRRLRFVVSDRVVGAQPAWCHIDAYDDVPLTSVIRDGRAVLGSLDELEARFPGVVAAQRRVGTRALVAWPLPGVGSPVGGLVLFFDEDQVFPEAQRQLIEAAAHSASDAVRRIWLARGRERDERPLEDPAGGERARELVDATLLSPASARRFLRRQLAGWGIGSEVIEAAEVALSELVTNAVIHARTTAEITLHVDEGVLGVAVRDHGGAEGADESAWPVELPDEEDPLRVFGRGLSLVAALVDRWGTEQDATGTIAWFELELERPDSESAQHG